MEKIRGLRHTVLWPHLNTVDQCQIPPDRAETTFHLAAVLKNTVIGTATFIVDVNKCFEEQNQYRLRAMATDPNYRGIGVGRLILKKAIQELKRKKVKILWCDARINATVFYEKQNFKVKGRVYQIPKIGPHKLMYIEL